MGGDNHVHFRLVLTKVECASVMPIPYVRPVHLGIVNITAGNPNYEATRLRNDNKEAIRLNREVSNIKKTLLKKLRKARLDVYLKAFKN